MFLHDVLFQIPDLENFFLVYIPENFLPTPSCTVYCEGVVGRFSGLEIRFLGRLKKSVKTKRASLGAPSIFGVSMKSDGESPTLYSMSTTTGTEPLSPPPYQPFPQRRESQELFVISICNQAHDSDEERGGFALSSMYPPPMGYSSTSTLSNSVVTTLPSRPSHSTLNLRIVPVLALPHSRWSSRYPLQPQLLIPNSLPDPHRLTIQFQPTKVLPAYKHTSNAPAPLKLGPEMKSFPELNTSPLRMNKRTPTSPPTGTSQILPHFPSSNIVDTRVLFLTISTFHERLVAKGERYLCQSFGSVIRNSKHLSILHVILILLVRPTFIS